MTYTTLLAIERMMDAKSCSLCKGIITQPTKKVLHSCSKTEREQLATRCIECVGKEKINCSFCKVEYIGKPEKYGLKNMCPECSLLRQTLVGEYGDIKKCKNMFRPGFMLRITYKIREESHDGYCSDPGEEEVVENEMTFAYPLLNQFKNEHINNDGIVDVDKASHLLSIYLFDDRSHGNGYCGMKTTYNLKSAVVVKDKRKIDLGE